MKIDGIDFSILRVIDASDTPLWKTEVYRRIQDGEGILESSRDVSVQTIVRRIDGLKEEGFVDSEITEPEDINRDIIIGFELTQEGKEKLEEKREDLTSEMISRSSILSGDELEVDVETIKNLLDEEIGLEESLEEIVGGCEKKGLVALLAFSHLKERIHKEVEEETLETLERIASSDDNLSRIIGRGLV